MAHSSPLSTPPEEIAKTINIITAIDGLNGRCTRRRLVYLVIGRKPVNEIIITDNEHSHLPHERVKIAVAGSWTSPFTQRRRDGLWRQKGEAVPWWTEAPLESAAARTTRPSSRVPLAGRTHRRSAGMTDAHKKKKRDEDLPASQMARLYPSCEQCVFLISDNERGSIQEL